MTWYLALSMDLTPFWALLGAERAAGESVSCPEVLRGEQVGWGNMNSRRLSVDRARTRTGERIPWDSQLLDAHVCVFLFDQISETGEAPVRTTCSP